MKCHAALQKPYSSCGCQSDTHIAGWLETHPRSGPLNLYILHRSCGTDSTHHWTRTNHPSDYSSFSVGQAVCPLLEVIEINTWFVLHLTFSYSCSIWCFTSLQCSPLFCAVSYSCYAVYFVLYILTRCTFAFLLLLGPMWVRYWFSLFSPCSSIAPFIVPLLYLWPARPVASCMIIRSVAVLISASRTAECSVLKAPCVYH